MAVVLHTTGRFRGAEVLDRQRNHLEPAEVKALFQQFQDDPFWDAYFRIQFYFGCRVSEVALILKEDVSFELGQIIIRRLKKKEGDGYREEVYGLPEALADMIRRVLPLTDPRNPFLFGSGIRRRTEPKERMAQFRQQPSGWRAVSRMTAAERFRQAARCAGISHRLAHTHVLRHTRATLLLASGAKEENVKILLGHTSITTTRRYLGVAERLRLRAQTEASLGLGDLGDLA